MIDKAGNKRSYFLLVLLGFEGFLNFSVERILREFCLERIHVFLNFIRSMEKLNGKGFWARLKFADCRY